MTLGTKVAVVGMRLSPRQIGRFSVTGISIPPMAGWRLEPISLLRDGLDRAIHQRAIHKAEWVDALYRSQDSAYLALCDGLIKELDTFDIIIFSTFSPIHPEILATRLRDKVKVIGFSDDPYSTYIRGIPYVWAFDAAYFISPSYSEAMDFPELLRRVGVARSRWMPLVQPIDFPLLDEEQLRRRDRAMCYVGFPTNSKFDRLIALRKALGNRFEVYGRWPLRGLAGFVRPLKRHRGFFQRVTSLSVEEKRHLYLATQIGFNMHVSDRPAECGNMRTYEAPQFGMMLLGDRGAKNLQNTIFEEGREAIYYSSIEEAIELADYYLTNSHERARIALNGHRRCHEEYRWEKVMEEFLSWL